jgi:hypothetical protein
LSGGFYPHLLRFVAVIYFEMGQKWENFSFGKKRLHD